MRLMAVEAIGTTGAKKEEHDNAVNSKGVWEAIVVAVGAKVTQGRRLKK